MITGLAALFILLFLGGGQETYFLNPDIKKNVKVYVKDKERKSEIDHLIKEIENDQKAFLKKRKKYYNKKTIELNLNYQSKREDFDKLFSEYFDERQLMMATYWEHESKIRSYFEEDEWNSMIENVLEKPDKEKTRKGFEKTIEGLFGGLESVCKKHITDSTKQESAVKAVIGQKEEIYRFLDEYLNRNYKNLEALRNRSATKDDFDQATATLSQLRKDFLDHIADMRFEILKNTTEEEWKKVAKEMDKLFTNGKNVI